MMKRKEKSTSLEELCIGHVCVVSGVEGETGDKQLEGKVGNEKEGGMKK